MKKYRYIDAKDYTLGLGVFINIVRFIDGLIAHHPEMKQLLFAAAFMNDQYFDRQAGLVEYRRFIEETSPATREMARLHQFAERRIKTLSDKETVYLSGKK